MNLQIGRASKSEVWYQEEVWYPVYFCVSVIFVVVEKKDYEYLNLILLSMTQEPPHQ